MIDKENGPENGPPVENTEDLASEATNIDFDQPDALVGLRLDERFLIEKNLTDGGADAGGMGVVYLAKDTKLLGKRVVVKILQESALKHPDVVRKFLHEKEALIRLDHPGIVRILDSGTLTDGNPFMVMEFIKGHSLRQTLRKNRQISFDVAAHLIESITDALGAAHSEKILHRDIKPENIMLTPRENNFDWVRLIDFGIARVEESELAPSTDISRVMGSVFYIAPEQLMGTRDLTPAADIYATAIVAYEMLTGELPFKPKAIVEMYQMEKDGVKTPPSELRPDLPGAAESILLSALEFDPEKRPQNALAFGRYLANELRHDSLRSDPFFASVKTEISKSPTEVIASPDSKGFTTAKRVTTNGSGDKFYGPIKWTVLATVVLAVLSISFGYLAWNTFNPIAGGDKAKNPAPADLGAGTTAANTGGNVMPISPGSVGIDPVWIPAGEFIMGSDTGEDSERPEHQVKISQGFWIGKYEVTQSQYENVIGTNPSNFKGCGNCPVETVSWTDAQEFISRLNAKNDGFVYSLPTEAEWEYAARAGTTGPYPGKLDDIAWYGKNSDSRTHPVGTKQPNAFRLYDMQGNVWEWCEDWYEFGYSAAPVTDPKGAANGEYRVHRGSSLKGDGNDTRSAYRGGNYPSLRTKFVGFRVAARLR